MESFDRAIEIKPAFAQAHNERGVALQQLKKPEMALISFEKAIALDPHLALAHLHRGRLLKDMQQYELALLSLEQATQLAPQNAQAHMEHGGALMATYKAMMAQPEAWQTKRHADGMPRFGRPMQLALQPFVKVAFSQKLIFSAPTASFE
jgi:tetratricopeptide (TPR) repeat protein